MLYLWDPLPEDPFNALFLTSLLRRDPGVKVGRAKLNQALYSPAIVASYAEVFDFVDGHLRRIGELVRSHPFDLGNDRVTALADIPCIARQLRLLEPTLNTVMAKQRPKRPALVHPACSLRAYRRSERPARGTRLLTLAVMCL